MVEHYHMHYYEYFKPQSEILYVLKSIKIIKYILDTLGGLFVSHIITPSIYIPTYTILN